MTNKNHHPDLVASVSAITHGVSEQKPKAAPKLASVAA
jgi:hypothetical protein